MRSILLASLALCVLQATPALAQDADGDGVPDLADAFPCDPTLAAVSFAPGEGQSGLLIFEDQWPQAGDLDFNDVVVAYHYSLRSDAQGQARALSVVLDVLALGGDFDNGLALQLPVPRGAVSSATRRIGGGAAFGLEPLTSESNFTVRLSPNLRELFGGQAGPINSRSDRPRVSSTRIELELGFTGAVALGLGAAPFDLFVFRSGDPSLEVHLPSYAGTSALDVSRFNTDDDDSRSGRWFVTGHGIPYALTLPQAALYPREGRAISSLFPDIISFAASGGTAATDFWATNVAGSHAYVDSGGVGPLSVPPVTQPAVDRSCVPVFGASALVDMQFEGSWANGGRISAVPSGALTLEASGGARSSGFASGFALNARFIDNEDIFVGDAGQHTFAAWYRGTQTNSSGNTYQPGVVIYGDPLNSVYVGLGVDDGRIAIANGTQARGSRVVNDGQWHHLAWVRRGQSWEAYVDGFQEIAGFNSAQGVVHQWIRQIGSGYPYAGVTAPTALDGIGIYDRALSASEILTLARTAVFEASGAAQAFHVPLGVSALDVKVWGGGGGGTLLNGGGHGGGGALVRATIPVTGGEALAIHVGGGGALKTQDHWHGGGGGGLSGIFRGSYDQAGAVVVAGGGGGSVHCANGGAGGAPNGSNGAGCGSSAAYGGRGATTSAPGAAGAHVSNTAPQPGRALFGGRGGDPQHSGWSADVFGGGAAGAIGGGGGGGFFGGGGGGHHHGVTGGAGGGGSSFSAAAGAVFLGGGAPVAGGAADADYGNNVGRGGTGAQGGQPGRVIIRW